MLELSAEEPSVLRCCILAPYVPLRARSKCKRVCRVKNQSMDGIMLTRLLYSNTYPRQQKGAEGNTVATKPANKCQQVNE